MRHKIVREVVEWTNGRCKSDLGVVTIAGKRIEEQAKCLARVVFLTFSALCTSTTIANPVCGLLKKGSNV